jgi:tetratricopeptide (TPR) repeat protein
MRAVRAAPRAGRGATPSMTSFHHCPAPPEPFVGRQRELARMSELLANEPVIVIAGLGGIGKSALALAAAGQATETTDLRPLFVCCQAGWASGALLNAINAELVRLGEESFVPFATDPALSLEDRTVHLAGLLDRGRFLLLLDDAGHVEPRDLAAVLGALTDRLARGRVVATSRRRLRVRGTLGRVPAELRLRGLAPADATRLFALLGGGTAGDALPRAAGHPLHVRLLARGSDPVHDTDVVTGVFEGQGAEEQEALTRLCVLRVPLVRSDMVTLAGPASAEIIDRLEEAFLVERLPQNRWRVAPFVAESLRWRLQSGFAGEVHRRAGELFESRFLTHKGPLPEVVLEAFHHLVMAGDSDRASLLLAQAAPDLMNAGCFRELLLMAGAADPDMLERPSELTLAVARSHRVVGQTQAAIRLLERLEAQCQGPSRLLSHVWAEMGQCHADLSRVDEAISLYFRALERCRQSGDREIEVDVTNKLATALKDRGAFDRALNLYRQAADLAGELGAERDLAWALHNMGKIHYLRGQLAEARGFAERAQAAYERLGDRLGRALTRNVIANIHRDLGDLAGAHQIYSENLVLYRQYGSRFGEAFCLSNLGDLMREEGRLPKAIAAYEQALALARTTGNRFGEGIYTTRLAEVHRATGEYARGLALADAARRLWEAIRNSSGVAWAIAVEGELHRDRGAYREALAALERAQSMRAELKEWGGVAQVLLVQSAILADVGELARANDLAREAGELLARRGGPEDPAALSTQAYVMLRQGDRAGAQRILEELLASPSASASARERARALGALATVLAEEGQTGRARQLVTEALALARSRFDQRGEAMALCQLGALAAHDGDLTAASDAYRDALRLAEKRSDLRAEAQAALGLGEASLSQGLDGEAQILLERADELARRCGFPRPGVRALLGLSELHLRRGPDERTRACELAAQAAERARSLALAPEEAMACGLLDLAGAPQSAERSVEWALAELAARHQPALARRLELDRLARG